MQAIRQNSPQIHLLMSQEQLYCKTMMTNSTQSLMTQELWVLQNSDMCKLGLTWARTYHGVFLNLMAWEILTPSTTEVILAREKCTDLLMKGNCLVISVSMQPDVLDRIHDAHKGIAKCKHRGRTSVWWPGLSRQMEKVVKKYPTNIKQYVNTTQPVIRTDFYELPWQKVAADLFELKDQHYLLICHWLLLLIYWGPALLHLT